MGTDKLAVRSYNLSGQAADTGRQLHLLDARVREKIAGAPAK